MLLTTRLPLGRAMNKTEGHRKIVINFVQGKPSKKSQSFPSREHGKRPLRQRKDGMQRQLVQFNVSNGSPMNPTNSNSWRGEFKKVKGLNCVHL